MTDEEITLYYNEYRLDALRINLVGQGRNLPQELYKALDRLYEQVVPSNEREEVEAFIKEEEQRDTERREAKKRFAVYHVSENGSDVYFTNEHFNSFHVAAYRYRLYNRGELSSEPKHFADAFIENDAIDAAEYEYLCDRMPNDFRITALIDFDLDNNIASVCDSSDNTWRYYRLYDLSVAAFKAYCGEYRLPEDRKQVFDEALSGKEIDVEGELLSETDAPTMQI